ncbi:MAG: hypothetical protein QF441_10635 [Bacteriovoracaceae bacterium]|jgi:hypothetical protein|nr:hypothetical protein [Bacteriovoracaceae bacterium]
MKALLSILLLIPTMALASEGYECHFASSYNADGVKIDINGQFSQVELIHKGKKSFYKKCKAEKDDFGLLIDCTQGLTDFMILLNNEVRPASGGIMSSTHDLFVDIDC